MDLSELEKKVARLMPKRLRRDPDGRIVESIVAPAPTQDAPPPAESVEPPPVKRAARIPQPERAIPETPVDQVELRPTELEPGARDVRERLLQRGASPALADRIVRGVRAADARGAFAIDAAVDALGQAFRFDPAPRMVDAPHVLAFVGPTGGGKTSTLAKLARKLRGAGRDVFLATLDPSSAGGDLDRTELPLHVVRDVAELHAEVVRAGGADLILVDTPGLSPRDEAGLEAIGETLRDIGRLGTARTYLVLPASASRAALGLATRAFQRTRPSAAIVTKLDETTEPGAALEEAQHAGLPLAFLCDGQDLRGHLARAGADRVADLFLRGHLS